VDGSVLNTNKKGLTEMKKLQKLSKEISDLTLKIERDYPGLYTHLHEMPDTIPNEEHPEMNVKEFEEYLESLQEMVKKYKINHRKV
jgi:DNA repair ATPase RecN